MPRYWRRSEARSLSSRLRRLPLPCSRGLFASRFDVSDPGWPAPLQPIRSRVSLRVERATLNVRHTADLLEPLSSAATICSTVSLSIAGGRPPLRPRRRAATSPAFTRSRIRDRSYWASVQKIVEELAMRGRGVDAFCEEAERHSPPLQASKPRLF